MFELITTERCSVCKEKFVVLGRKESLNVKCKCGVFDLKFMIFLFGKGYDEIEVSFLKYVYGLKDFDGLVKNGFFKVKEVNGKYVKRKYCCITKKFKRYLNSIVRLKSRLKEILRVFDYVL
ncbi:MAG: hypothetical protein NC926_08570 [Candidatus Omnitrophica bacterium]|nr:hypothetical protein [Candidatus Omnitrophota bacterium]